MMTGCVAGQRRLEPSKRGKIWLRTHEIRSCTQDCRKSCRYLVVAMAYSTLSDLRREGASDQCLGESRVTVTALGSAAIKRTKHSDINVNGLDKE